MNQISLRSPSKINFGLKIIAKRDDGFHEIETIFHRIDLFDEIELLETDGEIRLISDHPRIPKDSTNLAWKAAEKLRIKTNITKGVEIIIKKKIPIAAGLGGGSSNAASTLIGLNKLWGIDLPTEELILLAAELGADIPFFLLNTNSAIGRGKGEKLEKIKISGSFFILLINPNIEISTAWAYQAFKAELTKKSRKLIIKNFNLDINILDLISDADNDLEAAVIKKYSVISDIKNMLTDSGALVAAMSGSGSTVFGLFDGKAEALKCSEKVEHLGWSVFLTQTFNYSNLFI